MATITIPPALRSGDVVSPSVVIPAGMTSVAITYSIPQADRDNPAVSIHQMIEFSLDAGVTWKAYMDGGVWLGGTGTLSKDGLVTNPPPSMTIAGPSLAALVGKLTRGHWQIPVAMTVGTTVTTG